MSEQESTALAVQQPKPTAIARVPMAVIERIDEIAGGAVELFKGSRSFAIELRMAESIGALREALTPEVMAPVMGLQNTPLGFLTDRPDGYPPAVVRDAFIEAKMRGLGATGNEFNIIGARFYAAKAGLRRKIHDTEGLSDYKTYLAVPRSVNNGEGAVVDCKATWRMHGGTEQSLEASIPVKVNKGQGVDAILGKATRKLDARVLERLTGVTTPDGDATDVDVVEAPTRVTAPPPPLGASSPASPRPVTAPLDDLFGDDAEYKVYRDRLAVATSFDELKNVAQQIVASQKRGALNEEETDALRKQWEAARARVHAAAVAAEPAEPAAAPVTEPAAVPSTPPTVPAVGGFASDDEVGELTLRFVDVDTQKDLDAVAAGIGKLKLSPAQRSAVNHAYGEARQRVKDVAAGKVAPMPKAEG